jgi:hypothetical protein
MRAGRRRGVGGKFVVPVRRERAARMLQRRRNYGVPEYRSHACMHAFMLVAHFGVLAARWCVTGGEAAA